MFDFDCWQFSHEGVVADKSVNITVGEETRSYRLYAPSSVKGTCPLVISLHGASGCSDDRSPFGTDIADKVGCIVAYPQGKLQHFPVFGSDVTGWDASGEDNEDVDFINKYHKTFCENYSEVMRTVTNALIAKRSADIRR